MIKFNEGFEPEPKPDPEKQPGDLANEAFKFSGNVELLCNEVEAYKIIKPMAEAFLQKVNKLASDNDSLRVEWEKLGSFLSDLNLLYSTDEALDGIIEKFRKQKKEGADITEVNEEVDTQLSKLRTHNDELLSHAKTLMRKVREQYSGTQHLEDQFPLFTE